MVLRAAERKIRPALQRLRQRWERPILQTVRQLAAQVSERQCPASCDKIGLDGIVAAPEELFERLSLRPVQAFDGQIEKRHHNAARSPADLRKLPAVKVDMVDRQARLRQKRHSEVRADGGRYDEREPLHALCAQIVLHLPHLVGLACIALPGTVYRGCRQDAEAGQVLCHGPAALPRHAHGVKEQDRRLVSVSVGFKQHFRFLDFPTGSAGSPPRRGIRDGPSDMGPGCRRWYSRIYSRLRRSSSAPASRRSAPWPHNPRCTGRA